MKKRTTVLTALLLLAVVAVGCTALVTQPAAPAQAPAAPAAPAAATEQTPAAAELIVPPPPPAEGQVVEQPAASQPAAAQPVRVEEPLPFPDTYMTLLPSASGPHRVVVLEVKEDGTAQLTTDYQNGEAPIVEEGVWQDDGNGALILTLTGQADRVYAQPVQITFVQNDDRLISVTWDTALYGERGLKLLRQSALEDAIARVEQPLLTLDLTAGYPLDPFFVSVNGGGNLDAEIAAPGCEGFISANPAIKVDWEGDADQIKAFFFSDHDPMLMVQTPDGQLLCNDDANDQLLDPVVEITDPLTGTYEIWVGSFARGQLIPGILVLTTRPDVDLGTFALDQLVRREAVPEDLPRPQRGLPADLLQVALARYAAKVAPLGSELVQVDMTVEGNVPAFDIPFEDVLCNGFVGDRPDFVFSLAEATEQIRVFFEGDGDATLIVAGPEGRIYCTDDAAAGENINPLLDVPGAVLGNYAVFVGRVDPSQPVVGKLSVTTSDQPTPALLPPATQ